MDSQLLVMVKDDAMINKVGLKARPCEMGEKTTRATTYLLPLRSFN